MPDFIVVEVGLIMSSQHQPLLEIVGGPNGSGKSTFAESYLVRVLKRDSYLNRVLADDWIIFDNSGPRPEYICSKEAFEDFSPEVQEQFIKSFLKGKAVRG